MKVRHASVFERFKAGVVDMFMLMMPIQYFTTYIIAGSAQSFRTNQPLIAAAGGFYVLLIVLFFIFSDQTPGYRYARLHLRDASGRRLGALAVVVRTAVWLLSFALLFGMLAPFLRKDRAFLHDLASRSCVIAEAAGSSEAEAAPSEKPQKSADKSGKSGKSPRKIKERK